MVPSSLLRSPSSSAADIRSAERGLWYSPARRHPLGYLRRDRRGGPGLSDLTALEEVTMSQQHTNFTEERRKEIFRTLVEAQDQDMGVEQSRRVVAQQFDLTEAEVRRIEREGLDGMWPPL